MTKFQTLIDEGMEPTQEKAKRLADRGVWTAHAAKPFGIGFGGLVGSGNRFLFALARFRARRSLGASQSTNSRVTTGE